MFMKKKYNTIDEKEKKQKTLRIIAGIAVVLLVLGAIAASIYLGIILFKQPM